MKQTGVPAEPDKLSTTPGKETEQRVFFGAAIRNARKKKGITQEALGDKLGVSRFTVRNWESDINKPDYETLPVLCEILGISVQELFGDALPLQSVMDRMILKSLHQLSLNGQVMVKRIITAMLEEEQKKEKKELEKRKSELYCTHRLLEEVPGAVAAGTGYEFQDATPSTPFFVKTNNSNAYADAVVRVSGRSMEPKYHDGDYVYFKYTQDVSPGDDVVAGWNEGAIIKRLNEDYTLYSLNSALPFNYDGGEEGVRIIGKVLGIVDPSTDLPDEENLYTLKDLFHDELYDFKRKHENE